VQVAVITGASSGIGAQLARELTGRGWLCVLLARREERLRELAEELGGEYEVCDVSDRDDVEAAAARVRERHPHIKLLVNNAGIAARVRFDDGNPERIEQVVRTNYLGGVWCLRAFLLALEAARPSDVVNVVSVAGTVAVPPSGPYSASKHAQLAFSRATSASMRRRGISVHTLNPGLVETEGFPERATLRSPFLRRRVIDPEDVARHLAGLLGTGPGETTIPRWYRLPGIVQALAPNLVARLIARRGDTYRRQE
jgi:NAD(P)-dependent dehydrogenase (short-subunit alcohol dehydrogenase family)